MSIFGNNAGSSGAPNIFGGSSAAGAGTTSTGTPSIFGTPAKPAGTGLFGSGSTNAAGGTPSLFGGTSTPTPAPSGGLFGNNNTSSAGAGTSSTPTPSTSNPLFGAGAFSLPKPGEQANKDAPKPASSFFSQPASATNGTPAPSGGLFGSAPKPADATAAAGTSTPTPGAGLLGGGLFGKAPTTSTAQNPPAAAPSLFSLGGNKDSSAGSATPATSTTATAGGLGGGLFGATKPAEKKDDTAPAAPALGGGLFGSAPKPEEKKDGAAAGASAAPSGFGLSKPAGGLLGSTALGSSTAPAVAVPPPSMLRGKTIEEIVNKWSNELETHVKEFNKFAAEVSMWDRALIENGNSLATLYSHVLAAEREQSEVDQSLDHIEQQQKDLAATLDAYEKVTDEIFGGQGGSLRALDTGPADTERDKNYMLATDLHTHLDDLSGSLTQMIDSVNSLSMPSGNDNSLDNPMTQISQILSTHLDSLQWIDGAVREVEGKVTEVERRVNESGHASSLNGSAAKSRGFGMR